MRKCVRVRVSVSVRVRVRVRVRARARVRTYVRLSQYVCVKVLCISTSISASLV